ncbi:MAG: 50S ribosomal protein L10 [Planctomycetaceae bacterium]|nr:50S ribosomal protein L10 [Planctomycetaceae bacterium]
MSKKVKEMIIQEIEQQLQGNRDVLVLDSSKLDAVTDNKFRQTLESKGVHLLTVKNTLARKALGDVGDALRDVLAGPSTIVWGSEDIVALSRVVTKVVKENTKLELKGGAVEGQVLDSAAVEKLSKSPGRMELISQIAGLVLSPGAQLAGALLGPGGKLAGCVKAIADKEEETA